MPFERYCFVGMQSRRESCRRHSHCSSVISIGTLQMEKSKEEKFAKRDMNGMSRCKGRFCNSTLPDTAKFPAWLPCDHHITKLIIRDCQGDAQWSKRNTNRIEISFLADQGTASHQKTDLQLRNVEKT